MESESSPYQTLMFDSMVFWWWAWQIYTCYDFWSVTIIYLVSYSDLHEPLGGGVKFGVEHHISCWHSQLATVYQMYTRSPILNLGDATSTSLLVSLLAVLLACILVNFLIPEAGKISRKNLLGWSFFFFLDVWFHCSFSGIVELTRFDFCAFPGIIGKI